MVLLLICISETIPFVFAYDNINYARYLTAMLADMSTLNDDFPEIYKEFVAGNFATQLSSVAKFSRCEKDNVIEDLKQGYKNTRWNDWILNK